MKLNYLPARTSSNWATLLRCVLAGASCLAIGTPASGADAVVDSLMAEIRREAAVAVELGRAPADAGISASCVLSFADALDAERTYTLPMAAASSQATPTGVQWSCDGGACIVACKKQSGDRIAPRCEAPVRTALLPAKRPMNAALLSSLFVRLRQLCPTPSAAPN